MTFPRSLLLLWLLVACGSQGSTTHEPPISPPGSAAAPATARPVAIAFVFEGWEMWIGNDQLADVPEPEQHPGALVPFQAAFARVPLAELPPGSQATIVSYSDRVAVRLPMTPIEKVSAKAFGSQKDYYGTITRDLVGGVKLGLGELAKVRDARKVLVVIGDGSVTNTDTGKQELAALAKQAAAEKVEVVSIVYKVPLSPPSMIASLDANAFTVNTIDAIADQLGWLVSRLKQRPVAVPPGGTQPVVLGLLMSGWEMWIGNDEVIPEDDPSRYPGALSAIRTALEHTPATKFPDGSQAIVATYDSKSKIRLPMGPIANLDARAVGTQRDYQNTVGIELVSGVTLAISELAKVEGRRVLIVVGDGGDTNLEAARTQLRDLAKRAADLKIEIHAIVFKAKLSAEDTVVTQLDPRATTVTSTEALSRELAATLARLQKP